MKILVIPILLFCLVGTMFCQTFQYSKGWTNGKKRSNAPFILQEEGQEVLGICQMQWLKEMLQGKHRDQSLLPCEVLWKSSGSDAPDEFLQRYRRKAPSSNDMTNPDGSSDML